MVSVTDGPDSSNLVWFVTGVLVGIAVVIPIALLKRLVRGRSRRAIGWSAILFGWLGVHRFKLGNKKQGFITLGVTIASILPLFPGGFVMFVIGVIEGVKYLRLSDEEFETTYRSRQRKWF